MPLRGVTVLVVEADPDSRETTGLLLQHLGARGVQAKFHRKRKVLQGCRRSFVDSAETADGYVLPRTSSL